MRPDISAKDFAGAADFISNQSHSAVGTVHFGWQVCRQQAGANLMLAFKPLFQRDFFNGPQAFQRPGAEKFRGPAEPQTPSVAVNVSVEATLAKAYDRMQAAVQNRFPAVAEPGAAASAKTEAPDYSPQAVADRIVGFISDRLAQEKANGASEERLQDLYQQALKGVEQGLREGRDIIQDQGLFAGDTKDTFYQTVNRVADGLQQLGEELFGADLDAPAQPVPVTSGGFEASRSQVQIERSRSFEMEDRKSTRLNSSHVKTSYAVFCLKKEVLMIPTLLTATSVFIIAFIAAPPVDIDGIREPVSGSLLYGNNIISGAIIPTSAAIGLHFYPIWDVSYVAACPDICSLSLHDALPI